MAQFGRALVWGTSGQRFESARPDHYFANDRCFFLNENNFMDFKAVTRILLDNFEKENVRYALIGGFALGALGVPRSTVYIDFLVHRDDLSKIDRIMKKIIMNVFLKARTFHSMYHTLKFLERLIFSTPSGKYLSGC